VTVEQKLLNILLILELICEYIKQLHDNAAVKHEYNHNYLRSSDDHGLVHQ